MTGKVIDSSARGILVLLLPIAFLCVLLFKAWPYLLALLVIAISLTIWQHYQWLQWSKQVNPFFNLLIKENQGCLTPLDLSLKANISGSAAQRFLDRKAEEFGAKRRVYDDKGTVYYFLTASALGSIFESSEPLREPEYESLTNQAPRLIQLLTEMESEEFEDSGLTDDVEEETDDVEDEDEPFPQPFKNLGKLFDDDQDIPQKEEKIVQSLIQAELAKRLDVHPSTIGKHKSDPDFPEWSQSKDPEGIAWKYSRRRREFLPVQKKPS